MYPYCDLNSTPAVDICETIGHILTSNSATSSDLAVATELLCHLQCRVANLEGTHNSGRQLDTNMLKAMWHIE